MKNYKVIATLAAIGLYVLAGANSSLLYGQDHNIGSGDKKLTRGALSEWEAGREKREAQMKAYEEELERKRVEAKREYEEFLKSQKKGQTN